MAYMADLLHGSILADTRACCNLERDDSSFDLQLLPLINGQLMVAHQFGVGYDGFVVHSVAETWADLLGEEGEKLAAIQPWLGYSVKLMFDPPDNASVLKSYQDQINKFEWMLCSKSACSKIVKNYVTEEQGKIYDEPDEKKSAYEDPFGD